MIFGLPFLWHCRKEKNMKPAIGKHSKFREVSKYKQLYTLMIPGMLLILIFAYIPMMGIVIAFKDYTFVGGIFGSEWVGLKHFRKIFSDPYFYTVLRNTLVISLYKLFFNFVTPVAFAILLNEIKNRRYKKIVQTASYLPYFISWIVLSGIISSVFSLDGAVNAVVQFFGGTPKSFMTDKSIFRGIIIGTEMWKSFGWNAIVYLAAISGIDPTLYEAATVDGASRFKRIFHITIPAIMPVICIMLILNSASILNAGFDQVFNLYNDSVMEIADIIDTYVYRKGIEELQYSYSTSIGLFKSVICMLLMLISNTAVRKMGGEEYALW